MTSVFKTIKSKLTHNEKLFCYYEDDILRTISTKEFLNTIAKLSTALQKHGIKKNDKVAIFSPSSPFWVMMDMAITSVGAVSVPMFATISKINLSYQLKHSSIKHIFIDGNDTYTQLEPYIAQMDLIITKNISSRDTNQIFATIDWDDFIDIEPNTTHIDIDENDTATIIYTSGSTGIPKGVELSHKNLISQIKDISQILSLPPHTKILSFLPLAHVFERTVMNFYLCSDLSIYLVNDINQLGSKIKEINPTIMTTVPRLLEKIYDKIVQNINNKNILQKNIANLCLQRAITKNPNTKNNIIDKICHKLLYKKLLGIFGTNMRYIVSGGAKLRNDLYRFYLNIGVPLYQGYGLSEASPVVCSNYPNHTRYPSCGQPLPSVQIKLGDNSELLIKAPSVMKGYYKDTKSTLSTIQNNWLHTGDIASIDSDGYITIVSRCKELCKLSTGKYVATANIEELLCKSPHIEYACIVAEGYKFVSAIVFGNDNDKIDKYIQQINTKLNKTSKIKKYIISNNIPIIENGMLTPSMKLAKEVVENRFKKEIKNLYT